MSAFSFNIKCLSLSFSLLLLASCGGSSSDPAPTPPPTSTQLTWVSGQFEPYSKFAAFCSNPRTGTNPATGSPYPDQAGSVLHENHWLRSWSNDTYLWYSEIDDQNPASFSTPLAYFDVLKTDALTSSGAPKDRFHFTYDTEVYRQLVSSGASAGYGAKFVLIQSAPPRDIRIGYTEASSPANSAGLARGSEILEIDGVDAVNGTDTDTLNAGLFPSAAGEVHTFKVRDLGSNTIRDISMTSAVVTIDSVINETVIDQSGAKIGYMTFNTFSINDAEKHLIDAFTDLQSQNVDDLVLDLRYNGGGYLAISSQLAYMIAGGSNTNGQIFETTVFNDKHPNTNPVTGDPLSPTPFYTTSLGFSVSQGQALPTLNLNRVFVLSTSNTCSASEALINGLRGVNVEVILIGDTTCGKPYGFYATDNCGTTYFTIQFRGENNKAYGDYADGFTPSSSDNGQELVTGCTVADDFTHALADPQEALLANALNYRALGSCITPVVKKAWYDNDDKSKAGSLYESGELAKRLHLERSKIYGLPKR